MTKQQENTILKYCSRGDRYANDRYKEVITNYVHLIRNGSFKDVALMVTNSVNNGSEAESILLNIYDVLKNNHDDSRLGLKDQKWFITMMINVYMKLLNKDKHNQSLATFYKRGESK